VDVKRFLPVVLAVVGAAVAALAVNLLLIGYTTDRNDPVGNLSPRAPLSTEGTTTDRETTTRDETTTDETTTSETTTEGDDDSGRGRGRNRGRGGDGSGDDD
jgi:hypothetical protein